jgi:cystathionine beta-lyase
MAGEGSKGKAPTALDLDGHDLPPSPAPSTPRNGRKYALMTELVYLESNDQYNASSVPIYQVGKLLPMSQDVCCVDEEFG